MAQINLRNALMAGKRLPYDAEVEYLESTGTQHIDTGIDYFADFEITAKLRTSAANVTLYAGNSNQLERNNATNPNWRFRSDAGGIYNTTVPITELHTLAWRNGKVYSDGVEITTHAKGFSANRMYVFGYPASQYPVMVYALKLWDVNGLLVRDFIPVRKGTVGYLYDRVTRKLFGNAGTGDFVLGPDVVPVEYISAAKNTVSAYKYINTEVTPALNTKWELRAAFTRPASVGASTIGLYGGSNGRFDIGTRLGGEWMINRGAITTGGVADENWHTFLLDGPNGIGYVDGVATVTLGSSFAYDSTNLAKGTICLFCRGRGDRTPPIDLGGGVGVFVDMSIASSRIWDENGNLVRSFRPVRVGTDATSWEGAMMDVLTRRIYRNAGTGAFAYGNDLKYPIPVE